MLDIQENANFDNSKRRIDKFCEEFKITRLLTLANAEMIILRVVLEAR